MNSALPRAEAIIVAPAIAAYVGKLEALDFLGASPTQDGYAGPREVLAALHHVLAGGQVQIEIVSQGTESLIADLGDLLDLGIEQTSALNEVFDPSWARI